MKKLYKQKYLIATCVCVHCTYSSASLAETANELILKIEYEQVTVEESISHAAAASSSPVKRFYHIGKAVSNGLKIGTYYNELILGLNPGEEEYYRGAYEAGRMACKSFSDDMERGICTFDAIRYGEAIDKYSAIIGNQHSQAMVEAGCNYEITSYYEALFTDSIKTGTPKAPVLILE